MTTASFVLVLAVLILGGLIATVGDRIGTRVGKARLSLFKLRPRKTATLVTILTGTIISASTFGILFGASEQLRTGVFELEKIEGRLKRTRNQLDQARGQKDQVEQELAQARVEQSTAKRQLSQTNQQLKNTKQQLTDTDASLQAALTERSRAQAEAARKQAELSQTRSQLMSVSEQANALRADIRRLANERQQLQADRQRLIAQRDQEIRSRDQMIRQKETQLQELEVQQEFLTQAAQRLAQETQSLRVGNVAIERGQILASGVLRIVDPGSAHRAVDQLLQEANRQAAVLVRPGTRNQIIQITTGEVDQVIARIRDGQEYVVQILAVQNYLLGEVPIKVVATVVRNRAVLQPGDVVASIMLDPSTVSDREIQRRINLLISAANFRARNLGILSDSVLVGRIESLVAFIDQLRQVTQPLEIKAVATQTTYTAGPLKIELIAEQNGQILFRTQEGPPSRSTPSVEAPQPARTPDG